ncbi:unnamed protein product [Amoebophrya sp. A120]|nr:unnamed protein product [Amoebophrya sp. A120]|eukprot:GSA120T00019365001.1
MAICDGSEIALSANALSPAGTRWRRFFSALRLWAWYPRHGELELRREDLVQPALEHVEHASSFSSATAVVDHKRPARNSAEAGEPEPPNTTSCPLGTFASQLFLAAVSNANDPSVTDFLTDPNSFFLAWQAVEAQQQHGDPGQATSAAQVLVLEGVKAADSSKERPGRHAKNEGASTTSESPPSSSSPSSLVDTLLTRFPEDKSLIPWAPLFRALAAPIVDILELRDHDAASSAPDSAFDEQLQQTTLATAIFSGYLCPEVEYASAIFSGYLCPEVELAALGGEISQQERAELQNSHHHHVPANRRYGAGGAEESESVTELFGNADYASRGAKLCARAKAIANDVQDDEIGDVGRSNVVPEQKTATDAKTQPVASPSVAAPSAQTLLLDWMEQIGDVRNLVSRSAAFSTGNERNDAAHEEQRHRTRPTGAGQPVLPAASSLQNTPYCYAASDFLVDHEKKSSLSGSTPTRDRHSEAVEVSDNESPDEGSFAFEFSETMRQRWSAGVATRREERDKEAEGGGKATTTPLIPQGPAVDSGVLPCEAQFFLESVRDQNCNVIVETGIFQGSSTEYWCQYFEGAGENPQRGRVFAIDRALPAGRTPDSYCTKVVEDDGARSASSRETTQTAHIHQIQSQPNLLRIFEGDAFDLVPMLLAQLQQQNRQVFGMDEEVGDHGDRREKSVQNIQEHPLQNRVCLFLDGPKGAVAVRWAEELFVRFANLIKIIGFHDMHAEVKTENYFVEEARMREILSDDSPPPARTGTKDITTSESPSPTSTSASSPPQPHKNLARLRLEKSRHPTRFTEDGPGNHVVGIMYPAEK